MSQRFKPWDVVTVPFPFTDGETIKKRPVVVVSTETLSKNFSIYWLAMITSAENKSWPDDVAIKDLKAAGLSKPSVVRPVKINTLEETRITGKIGSLGKNERAKIRKALSQFIAAV